MNERRLPDPVDGPGASAAAATQAAPDGVVTLDVRDDIRNGREPFTRIMTAVAALGCDKRLRLIAPFEPVPLYHVLARQGFEHSTRRTSSGDWEVHFAPAAGPPEAEPPPAPPVPTAATTLEVDARGLEPPQPLVKILEALASLPAGADLNARTDRRPMHLYAQLESRGFRGETEEQTDGSFITHIRRN